MIRVYLAGPLTTFGSIDENRDAFRKAAAELRHYGLEVINPIELYDGDDWKGAMKVCLPALLDANLVCLLPMWQRSIGASLEYEVATKAGIPARGYEEIRSMYFGLLTKKGVFNNAM